jgi:mono/diheme cytochrome c family protein
VIRAALAALALATAVLAAGCGAVAHISVGEGDSSSGKTLFLQKCGSCHVLANAETQGTVGPNLDDAFESARQQGFDESTILNVVRGQIAYPEKPMPAGLVEGDDADDVAAYVAQCAGAPSCGVRATGAETTTGATTTTPPSEGGGGAAQAMGKQVFTTNCGSCHTLQDAGTSGNVGPNLDDLKPAKAVVQKQVENGGGGMPAFKGQLSPAQISAVATYVSSVAGK